jgi:hypothetical protein
MLAPRELLLQNAKMIRAGKARRRNIGFGVEVRAVGVWRQLIYWPPLYLVRRPGRPAAAFWFGFIPRGQSLAEFRERAGG